MVSQLNINRPHSEQDYYEAFSSAYISLAGDKQGPPIKVDCANGVGGPKLKHLAGILRDQLDLKVYNNSGEEGAEVTGKLNDKCGADHVKLMQNAPQGIDYNEGEHCYSMDGDADRVVFFYQSEYTFHMLDGDKISCLYGMFVQKMLTEADVQLSLGVVQTAYANGSSTSYLKSLGIPTSCVPTGVKHLHRRPGSYDIGIYFEANGHGTVLFSDKALESINAAAGSKHQTKAKAAACHLLSFTQVVNSIVGDALSNILAIEAVLAMLKLSAVGWDNLYTDLPYRQLKIAVKDRTIFETYDAERKVSKPDTIQPRIDAMVSELSTARCFVRPSGTEDVVRVHAECLTQREADNLAMRVGEMVVDCVEVFCNQ